MSTTSAERLGAGRYVAAGSRPESAVTSVHELTTADGATVRGVLASVPGATTVVSLMHPRQDLTHHPLVPLLLQAGAAVWTQHARTASNDLTLVHEQAILDEGRMAERLALAARACGLGSVIATLNKEVSAALTDPKIKARIDQLGGVPLTMSPGEFGKFVADETEKMAKVIKAAGISAK